MAILEIRLYGDTTLRERATSIERITDVERQLAQDMLETMYANRGVGLAAPQVGVLKRLIVVDVEPDDDTCSPIVLINPTLVHQEGEISGEEGCLSFPELRADVTRATHVVVEGLDVTGQPAQVDGTELLARALQHEIEHLDGILFIDHFSRLKRKLLKNQLNKIKQNSKSGAA